MNLLLWKEYRQNRKILLAIAVFLCAPYVIALPIGIVPRIRSTTEYGNPTELVAWSKIFGICSISSLALLVVGCAFIAGNIVAGERADRSAEFVAYLPISSRRAITAKALLCGIAIIAAALANFAVALISTKLGWNLRLDEVIREVGVGSTVGILVFGTAWLVSTLIGTPAIAAASGIGSAVLLYTAWGLVDYSRDYGDGAPALEQWIIPLSLLIGVGSFVAGVLYYVRRVEP